MRLDYTYQRTAAVAVITITGGTVTIDDMYTGITRGTVTGASTGAFEVDSQQMLARCGGPGPLPFSLTGDAALVLS